MPSTPERLTALEVTITDIKENHLVHLQAGIDRVDSRSWWILGTIVLGNVASILFILWK